MLKLLATIFFAVVFLGSRVLVVAARESDPRTFATQRVTFARICIERRSRMIGNLIRQTASLPSGKYAEAITELKKNMRENLALTRLVVNDIITDRSLNVTFNETKCRSFYADHEKTEREIDKNLDQRLSAASNATLTRLKKAKDAADAALEQFIDLERKAASCYQKQCFAVAATAEAIRNGVFMNFSELRCLDKLPSKGMDLILQMALNCFKEKGQRVVLKTYECIYNGHPPAVPHHHHRHQPDRQA